MVLSLVGGKFANALIDRINFQKLGAYFQRVIDRNKKKKDPSCFNSFDGTTLVATENGLVPISEIKIGDKVWAYNEANQTKSLQEVTHLIRGENYKELIDIELTSGEIITTTDNHPFWELNTKEWIEADELTNSSILYNINDKNVTIKSLTNYAKNKRVYNLTVANIHTYYVGLGGVLGHNEGCRPPNLAPIGASRNGAFNKIKKDFNIPKRQQPIPQVQPNGRYKQYKIEYDRNTGKEIKLYTFKNNDGKYIEIRDDRYGHTFPKDPSQDRGSHFNAGERGQKLKDHYDYQ